MFRFKFLVLTVCQLFIFGIASAQDTLTLSLQQVVEMASAQASKSYLLKHQYLGSYWAYKSFRAGLLPALSLQAEMPNFVRSISPVTQEDGSIEYRYRYFSTSSIELSLNQKIALTGGSVFLSTSLQRTDFFNENNTVSYLSTPINIGVIQPLFAHNSYKWEKLIEPIKYQEAEKEYLTEREAISKEVTGLFFDLALARLNIEIARANFSVNDTLFQIAQGRYNIGTIAQDELLQMELTHLNAKSALNDAVLNLEIAEFNLSSFLRLKSTIKLQLVIPEKISLINIATEKAISEAKKNNPNILSYNRQLIEAERDVQKTKAESRLNADIYAIFGLTQSAQNIEEVYDNPQDRQQFQLGIEIPLLDWGQAKGKNKMAESACEVVNLQIEQKLLDFEQNVFLQTALFNKLNEQLLIAAKSDTIAQLRYRVSKQRFMIGKIDVLNLKMAAGEKDLAQRDYLQSLRLYWIQYYQMRMITLYDFVENKIITADFNNL